MTLPGSTRTAAGKRGGVSLLEARDALFGRQHEAAYLFASKQWLVQVDLVHAAYHDVQGMERVFAHVLAKGVKLPLEWRIHTARSPHMPGRVPERVFSEHDRVGVGAQQPHEKRILVILPADLRAS